MTKENDFKFGESLAENALSYVVRQADEELYRYLKAGDFCYIFNSRQMGKTSLIVRTQNRLKAEGYACTSLDFSVRVNRDMKSEQWYAGIVYKLVTNFELGNPKDFLLNWWRDRSAISGVERLDEFIETILLTSIKSQIVIFIDEIDSVLSLQFPTDDFFALIRSCYEKRNYNPEYKRLTFVLVGVATPGDLIGDKRRTPFNIGRAIQLDGFKENEIEPLAKGFNEYARYLSASQELEKNELAEALAAREEEVRILAQANDTLRQAQTKSEEANQALKKSLRMVWFGAGLLAVSIIVSSVFIQKQLHDATVERLEETGVVCQIK
ncbi:AAA-like domain-containing protein [Calothrix sp. CCY 0018]|uniref:AAA-like domain-containing protein n=1 Tax=Calothrix sp. CCY 0018 TaxID=3103864 RepID=UPI0039C655F2